MEVQVDYFTANDDYLTSLAEEDGDVTKMLLMRFRILDGDNLKVTNNSSATVIDLSGFKDNNTPRHFLFLSTLELLA